MLELCNKKYNIQHFNAWLHSPPTSNLIWLATMPPQLFPWNKNFTWLQGFCFPHKHKTVTKKYTGSQKSSGSYNYAPMDTSNGITLIKFTEKSGNCSKLGQQNSRCPHNIQPHILLPSENQKIKPDAKLGLHGDSKLYLHWQQQSGIMVILRPWKEVPFTCPSSFYT